MKKIEYELIYKPNSVVAGTVSALTKRIKKIRWSKTNNSRRYK